MEAYVPSHPDIFEVNFKEGYCSALIARKVRLHTPWFELLPNPAGVHV